MASSSSSSISSTVFAIISLITITPAAASWTGVAYPESSITPAKAISQFLASHNAVRRQVGVPKLVWDKKLARFAKAYAGQRRGDCALVHSPGYAYGENIFWGQGRRWLIPDAVAKWAEERRWYHYGNNSCDAGADCTHYTQMVWRTTERLGCAKIVCNTGNTFIVCEYYPPGNYIGARPYIEKPST